MPGSSIWDQLEVAFSESAIANDETDEKQLVSPGVAGLQEIIEGVLGSGKVTSEDLETFYAKADWDQEHSLTLADFRSIVSSLNLPALQDEDGTPVDDEEDEEVDGDGNAKQNASDSSEPIVVAKQLADVYDKIKESFDEQNFKHSFNDETFVPLIPPQTIVDTGKRENAVKAYQSVTPNLLPRVNKQLWSDWHDEQEVAGMLGEDVETNQHTSFQNFVETNYVKTILEIAGEAAKQEPKFTPKVAPDVGASPEVHEQRVELLSKAQVTDNKEAERKVKELYDRFVKSKKPDIQRRLPCEPPANFWVKNYYECLKEAVENRQSSSNVASPVAKKSRSADAGYIENKTSHTADGSRSREVGAVGVQSLTTTQNVSLSGIDELLSGQGFSSDPVVPEVLHFMSAADILQTNNEHTRCKFQGALVHIDSQPRSLQREPQSSSSRKRDAGSLDENLAIDVLILDKTGAVNVVVFGELANDLSRKANEMLEKANRGQTVSRIVEIDKARIVSMAKNDWNGKSLSRINVLWTIKAINNDSGTSIRFVKQASAVGLTTASFAVPPAACCVKKFATLANQHQQLEAPFRGTFNGVIMDVGPMDVTQTGNQKRHFSLVDAFGTYILCVAHAQNAASKAIKEHQEVVIYFGLGRAKIGRSPGMLYLMKDAIIFPVGEPRIVVTAMQRELEIV